MRNTYFITGFPRSRTAWLANLLTYGRSFCFHEGLMFSDMDMKKLKSFYASMDHDYIGNACSTIPFFLNEYRENFPNSKYVLIERDPIEAANSTTFAFGNGTATIIEMLPKIQELKERVNPLIIKYRELNDKEAIKTIWSYCIPGIPFDHLRWEMLADFNVQLTGTGMDKRRALVCR